MSVLSLIAVLSSTLFADDPVVEVTNQTSIVLCHELPERSGGEIFYQGMHTVTQSGLQVFQTIHGKVEIEAYRSGTPFLGSVIRQTSCGCRSLEVATNGVQTYAGSGDYTVQSIHEGILTIDVNIGIPNPLPEIVSTHDNCTLVDEEPCRPLNKAWGEPCEHSPILIDLDRNGFRFGGPVSAVDFDLYNTGNPVRIQWVLPNSDDAFLVWDQNQNLAVDGGSELFGNGSLMLDQQDFALNGFLALAQHDDEPHGGNADGFITDDDEIWSDLYLWTDRNADGQSTQDELRSLEEHGIAKLETIPRESPRVDRHGNRLKFWARSYSVSGKKHKMLDVFFPEVE